MVSCASSHGQVPARQFRDTVFAARGGPFPGSRPPSRLTSLPPPGPWESVRPAVETSFSTQSASDFQQVILLPETRFLPLQCGPAHGSCITGLLWGAVRSLFWERTLQNINVLLVSAATICASSSSHCRLRRHRWSCGVGDRVFGIAAAGGGILGSSQDRVCSAATLRGGHPS